VYAGQPKTAPFSLARPGLNCSPVKLTVVWIGKTKDPAIRELTNGYLKRLARYAQSEGVALKDEAALLRLQARGSPTLVLLDARGKQFSSEELAGFIGSHQDRSSSALIFAVGPANGFTQQTRSAATLLFSLGKLTLPHELARVVLLEQLYRAFTILNRHPYHLGH
jgi:23S rRNA (pseudouridine1915-N3)-methyltransferase